MRWTIRPHGRRQLRALLSFWVMVSVSLLVLALAGSGWVAAALSDYVEQTYTAIMAVARAVGYDNDVTFRRLFKKYVGITPSEYREQKQARKGES